MLVADQRLKFKRSKQTVGVALLDRFVHESERTGGVDVEGAPVHIKTGARPRICVYILRPVALAGRRQ